MKWMESSNEFKGNVTFFQVLVLVYLPTYMHVSVCVCFVIQASIFSVMWYANNIHIFVWNGLCIHNMSICHKVHSESALQNVPKILINFFFDFFQVRTLFVSGLPMDAKPRELYLLFRGYGVSNTFYIFFGLASVLLWTCCFVMLRKTRLLIALILIL